MLRFKASHDWASRENWGNEYRNDTQLNDVPKSLKDQQSRNCQVFFLCFPSLVHEVFFLAFPPCLLGIRRCGAIFEASTLSSTECSVHKWVIKNH